MFLVWDFRGLTSPTRRFDVIISVKKFLPSLIVLFEHKISGDNVKILVRSMNPKKEFFANSNSTSKCRIFIWNPLIWICDDKESTMQFYSRYLLNNRGLEFHFPAVYGLYHNLIGATCRTILLV